MTTTFKTTSTACDVMYNQCVAQHLDPDTHLTIDSAQTEENDCSSNKFMLENMLL